MKRISLAILTLCCCTTAAPAQKGRNIFGDTWTGVVVAADEGRREVRLRSANEKKPGDFEGVLDEKLQVWRRDGSFDRPARVPLPAGERVLVNYKSKEETVGGKKVRVNRISRLIFLGPDDFTILRSRLNIPDATPVTPSQSTRLPTTEPLKVYVVVDYPSVREGLDSWLNGWLKEKAAKYGAVELVSTLEGADAALVVHKGTRPGNPDLFALLEGSVQPSFPEGEAASGFLLTRAGGGFAVVWQEMLFIPRVGAVGVGGRLHSQLEKQFKARRGK